MKVRIIQTRFWDDNEVLNLSKLARYLYIYILTCAYINICAVFQLADMKIMFETGLSNDELDNSKKEVDKCGKIKFYNGWIFVVNARKNNRFERSPDNYKAMMNEFSKVPSEVLIKFNIKLDSSVDTSVGSSVDTTKKPIIKSKKPKKETIMIDVIFSPEVLRVMDYYKKIFKVSTIKKIIENSASARKLIESYGTGSVLKMIEEAKKAKTKKYYPLISNLMDLEEKWDKLDSMLARDKAEEPKKEDLSVKTSIGKEVI